MLANDMKKGMKIRTRSGFSGEMADNRKGISRLVKVDGICGQEFGSEYIFNITFVEGENGWERVELNETQKTKAKMIKGMGF